MKCLGSFRIYFNRHGAEPFMWRVAPMRRDSTHISCEIAVTSVIITSAVVQTVYQAKDEPDDEDGKPSAWLETEGVLTVDDFGIATIRSERP